VETYELGERYRKVLADEGVQVRLVPTAGSAENLAMLRDPNSGVSVALMQGLCDHGFCACTEN
jgi:TRAP-type uncharacterized transport system substrate-binding protein